MRAGLGLAAIPIALDMQAICDHPLCGGRDPRIRMRWSLSRRSVIDARQTAVCGQTAELIKNLAAADESE